MKAGHLTWALYVVGSLLVFASWVGLVPAGVGWAGWLMALCGWGIPARRRQDRVNLVAAEIERLDLLRQRRVISDEEFEARKLRLLND